MSLPGRDRLVTPHEILNYFTDGRVKKNIYMEIFADYSNNLPWKFAFNLNNIPLKFAPKIQAVLDQSFKDYETVCNYFTDNQVCVKDFFGQEDSSKKYACLMATDRNGKMTLGRFEPIMQSGDLSNLNVSFYEFSRAILKKPEHIICFQTNTFLTVEISVSSIEKAIKLINIPVVDVNKYSVKYGSNPILLAISKGWNHLGTDISNGTKKIKLGEKSQRDVITSLLNRPDLDLNCIHLINGMTPLHIACLRGDDIELIELLIARGANREAEDYSGKKPLDCLNENYENVRTCMIELTGGDLNNSTLFTAENLKNFPENALYTATLPMRNIRESNIEKIKAKLTQDPMKVRSMVGPYETP